MARAMDRRVGATLGALSIAIGCRSSSPASDSGGTDAGESSANATASDGGDESTGAESVGITGVGQKGPLLLGSAVTLTPLDGAGAPTGSSFPGQQ